MHAGKQSELLQHANSGDPISATTQEMGSNKYESPGMNSDQIVGLAVLPVAMGPAWPAQSDHKQQTRTLDMNAVVHQRVNDESRSHTSDQTDVSFAKEAANSAMWVIPSSCLQNLGQHNSRQQSSQHSNPEQQQLHQGCRALLAQLLSSSPPAVCFDSQGTHFV